jgi:hypothetical protein
VIFGEKMTKENQRLNIYDVCFYQEPEQEVALIPDSVDSLIGRGGVVEIGDPQNRRFHGVRYGIQLVKEGQIIAESHFHGTGSLPDTRARVAEYAQAVAQRISEISATGEGILVCVHSDRKSGGKCINPGDSKVGWHRGTLEETLSRYLPKAKITTPREDERLPSDFY